MFRVNQTYNSLNGPKSCRRPVVNLSYATKSYRVNRPLDSLESTLKNLCSKMTIVEGDISKLKTDARDTDTKMQQMDEGLKWLNKEMEDLKLKMKYLEAAKEDLHTKQLYTEAYSRRKNLKVFGLAEKETQGTEVSEAINTRELLLEFLKNGLGFEDPEKKTRFWKNTTDHRKIFALPGSRDGFESFVSSS